MRDIFLTNDTMVTDEILGRYISYLVEGFTLQNIKIAVDTIYGYLGAVNAYYKQFRLSEPWNKKDDSEGATLLRKIKEFEGASAKREPLHDRVLAQMLDMSTGGPPHGFRRAMWLWTNVGRYAGFRRQEFAMEKKDVIQVYVKPNGDQVVRAFTVKDFIFYDDDGMQIEFQAVKSSRDLAEQVGHHYGIQKNRVNNQVITQNRDCTFPKLCAVETSIEIVLLAEALGSTKPDDPLCVFQTDDGDIVYLTGDMITKYYRYVTRLVFPTISDAELKLYSCHSIRVKAAVLLSEAGKDGPYIKLRLRWLSDCFEVYLRNTHTICAQHNAALRDVNDILLALALTESNIPQRAIHTQGEVVTDIELEDED